MSENLIANKSYAFALKVIGLYKLLAFDKKEFVLSKQLLRSGTAIGALVREAEHAQSKADFLNKMNIGLKEANETMYWLMLLRDSDYIDEKMFNSIYPYSEEVTKMLAAIVKTTKANLKR